MINKIDKERRHSKPPWSYIYFQLAVFSVLETNKRHRGRGLGYKEGVTTIAICKS
jgi:hypothetical protein